MAIQQYLCPECGVALQSAQDVVGKAVRCLGCQAVFTARPAPTISREAPPPAPREPPRPKAKSKPRPEPRYEDNDEPRYEPELPPIPKDRKLPVAVFVIGGAVLLAIGATIFVAVRFRDKKPDTATIAQAEVKPPKKVEDKPPATDTKPPAAPSRSRTEEEEEVAVVPTIPSKDLPAKKGPPDLNSLLPSLPGFTPKDPPGGESRPKDPPPAKSTEAPSKPTSADTRPESTEQPARGDGSIPPELLTRLKAATVFIKVAAGRGQGSGSGFVLKVDGNTALVVTNNHVVTLGGKASNDAQYDLVFHSGRKSEFSLKGDLVVGDKDHDLALLRVNGVLGHSDFPAPLNTTDKAPLAETMPVYVIGFPFGEMLATTKGNPAVTIGKGTISSLREDDAGDAAFIQIDGDVNPGNSGGPVVDARGRLVGVTVAKLKGTNIGLAIPPIELSRMLAGRLGNLEFRIARNQVPNVEIDVHGSLIDPMDRVAACSLLVARSDDLKEKPAVGAGGKWAPLIGAEKVEMKVAGRGVSGVVKLPIRDRDKGQVEFLFQPACVDREGKTTYFPPVTKILREGQPEITIPFGPQGPGTMPGPPGGPGGPGKGPPGYRPGAGPRGPGLSPIPTPPGPPGGPGSPGSGTPPGGGYGSGSGGPGFGGGFGGVPGSPPAPGSPALPGGPTAPGGGSGSGSGGPGFGGGGGGGAGTPPGGPVSPGTGPPFPGRPGG